MDWIGLEVRLSSVTLGYAAVVCVCVCVCCVAEDLGSSVLLQVVCRQPMHLRVWHDGLSYDLPKGRYNVFYAFALFMHLTQRFKDSFVGSIDASVLCSELLSRR